jgi:hypothetical protein
MRVRPGSASLLIILSLLGFADAAIAQPGLELSAGAMFYGDNTEFRNPFREGETLFGAAVRLDASIELSDTVSLALGVFGNQRFGGEQSFELVRPVIALTVQGPRSRLVFGTLFTPHCAGGPDRTGPHGLLPPIQRETLAFERPYEAGLQWSVSGARWNHDAWLDWQRLNTPEHRERLDAGSRVEWHAAGLLFLPFQGHIVHEGGQLFASGPVRDSFAFASGIVLSNRRAADFRLKAEVTKKGAATKTTGDSTQPDGSMQSGRSASGGIPNGPSGPSVILTLELLGLWSRHTPDREAVPPTRAGGAFFGRAAIEKHRWRLHLIAWRGDDYIKDEGDPNYLSIRRDGSRYRGIRDYAEAGITRTWPLAPGARVETSFRFHRVERHYEYSYRILALVDFRARVK